MKSKSGYIIGTLKKRNESLSQENDKLKDEIERLNMELSEATHNIKTMQECANQNQKIKTNLNNKIQELQNELNISTDIQRQTEDLLRRAKQSNTDVNARLSYQIRETNMWNNKFNKLNSYVRNVGITIIIFGVIILFTQYM